MRSVSELNINEGGKPVNRAAPTDKEISDFEDHFAVTLPDDYWRFLKVVNGGHPELDLVMPIGHPGVAPWGVSRFYHLNDDKGSPYSLWKATERWRAILGEGAIPFATEAGGNQFFFDLRTVPPAVKGCLHDENFAVVDIAPSFEAFVDRLSLDPDMI